LLSSSPSSTGIRSSRWVTHFCAESAMRYLRVTGRYCGTRSCGRSVASTPTVASPRSLTTRRPVRCRCAPQSPSTYIPLSRARASISLALVLSLILFFCRRRRVTTFDCVGRSRGTPLVRRGQRDAATCHRGELADGACVCVCYPSSHTVVIVRCDDPAAASCAGQGRGGTVARRLHGHRRHRGVRQRGAH
jgi:hypothetical protein